MRVYDATGKLLVHRTSDALAAADYDSGWVSFSQGEEKELTHDLGTSDLMIDIMGRVSQTASEANNVYGHWSLNESTGTNVPDTSGNGYDGTTQNMENADWIAGKLNNCLTFDGVDEYVSFGDIAIFSRLDDFSIEAWVKTTMAGTGMIVAKQGGAGAKQGYCFFMASGRLHCILANTVLAGGNRIQVSSTNTVNDGSWHHVVVTYDGSSAASGVNFYIDGSLETPITIFDNLTGSISTSEDFEIGARGSGGYNRFAGDIDEVLVYEKELALSYIEDRYNSGNGLEDYTLETVSNEGIGNSSTGYYISDLTSTTIKVTRGATNSTASEIRTRIWSA